MNEDIVASEDGVSALGERSGIDDLEMGLRDTSTQLHFEAGPNYDDRLAAVLRATEEGRNAFLEAASILLRALAEIPNELNHQAMNGLHELLRQEIQLFTRLCEQANLRRDQMLAVRYALCTALDEAVNLRSLNEAGQENPVAWTTQALLNEFHGDGEGGRKVFLLIGRLANAPQEHVHVLEVIHHLLSLGFMGDYRVQADGHRLIESIRHRLYTLVASSREPVPRELSPHWRGTPQGKFRLLRSIPVWVSASVLLLVLFGQFVWYKYHLLNLSENLQKRISAIYLMEPAHSSLRLSELLATEIAQGKVRVEEDSAHAIVVFKGDGMFSGGLAMLSPATREIVEKVGRAVADVQGRVRVVGHSDNQKLSGKNPEFKNNQILSEKRAQAVVQVMTEMGVDNSRIEVAGMGDTQPITSNSTASGRAKNRRVEIEVFFAPASVTPKAQ